MVTGESNEVDRDMLCVECKMLVTQRDVKSVYRNQKCVWSSNQFSFDVTEYTCDETLDKFQVLST